MIDRHCLILNTALLADVRVRLNVLLEDIHTFDEYTTVLVNLEYSAPLSPGFSVFDDDFIAFPDFVHNCYRRCRAPREPRAPAK